MVSAWFHVWIKKKAESSLYVALRFRISNPADKRGVRGEAPAIFGRKKALAVTAGKGCRGLEYPPWRIFRLGL